MESKSKRRPSKFNLPIDLTERLAQAVPTGKRSRFVAKAIDNALKADAKKRLLEILDNLPTHSTGGENSVEVLPGLRQERTRAITRRHRPLSQ
jgi:hypothetical protein